MLQERTQIILKVKKEVTEFRKQLERKNSVRHLRVK